MKKIICFSLVFTMIFSSCKKDTNTSVTQIENPNSKTFINGQGNIFNPTVPVQVEHGMLVFNNYNEYGLFLDEVQQATPNSVKNWEDGIGIRTIRTRFNDIVIAESNYDTYLSSLSSTEQEALLNGPILHTDEYHQGIDDGIIMELDNSEGAAWDYVVCSPGDAGALNEHGLVKVGNRIIQYTPTATKIILDGDFDKIPLLDLYTQDATDENNGIAADFYSTAKTTASLYTSFSSTVPNWHYEGNRKRSKVWISGYSYPFAFWGSSGITSDCTQLLLCNFEIRTEAQNKNFWGKWVFNSFWPSLLIQNANWTYTYSRYADGGCGLSTFTSGNNLTYSSSPHPWYPSKINYNVGGTNKGFFRMVPHGVWSASYNPGFFASGFYVHYNITLKYGGKDYPAFIL